MNFLLWTKRSHGSTNFDTFRCFGENLPNSLYHFPNCKSVFLQTCMTLQCHEGYFLCTYLGQKWYNLRERDQSKWKYWRFVSAHVKIYQILVIFEITNWFFLVSWEITPQYFFSWNFIYFQQKDPFKVQISWNQKSEIWHFDGPLLSK